MKKKIAAPDEEKRKYLTKKLLQGFLWFVVLFGGYILAKKYFDFSFENFLGSYYHKPSVIYTIFLISEIIFGIIPPEFFMIWALKDNDPYKYGYIILLLSTLSYLSGVLGYCLGNKFNHISLYRLLRVKYLSQFEKRLKQFGSFLIIVASTTPVPFSAIAMLMGASSYPLKKYLYYSLFRFVRFVVYAVIIWIGNIN